MIAANPRKKKKAKKAALNRSWTYDEMVAELPETNQPTELWDGEIIVSPSPSFFHQEIVVRFHDQLAAWVRGHKLGKTALAPMDMVLSPRRVTQPEVMFISNARLGIIRDRVRGVADLVVEIISPKSRGRDRIDKRDLYEQYGVQEYWLIDPEAQTVEVLCLESGVYHLAGRWQPGERAASRLLAGFEVAVGDLFAGAPPA